MEIDKLIEQRQEIKRQHPGITKVNLFDHRKNMHDDIGDGSTEGVYSEFEITPMIIEEKDELEYHKEVTGHDFKPWIAISFDNYDYNE